jgi:tetratricopeptide (TPR) repeat protein
MGDVGLEAPDLDDVDEEAGRFKRMIAVAVVLVTFMGAVVAYYQAVESNKEDIAARDAQRDAIVGLGDQVDASAELATDLSIASSVDAQRQRQALSASRVNSFNEEGDDDAALAARDRFAAVAEALALVTPIDGADPATFDVESATLQERPDAARLRQTISADLANDHGDKADAFVAVLTVLAVALFLLGLSLTVHGRSRFVLALPGLVLAVACLGWAAFIARQDVTRVSERAIQAAAEGQRLQAAGDFEGAIDAYDDAIDDSPDFAAAFARRAGARFVQGSPQRGQTSFTSITSDEALDDALDDLEQALALGADTDVTTVADAGFFTFLSGDFERSVELSERAIALNDRLPPTWFNLGVAELALDHEDEAARAYRRGLAVLDDIPDPGTRSAILAGARTDLSILRELLSDSELEDVASLIRTAEVDLAAFELDTSLCAGEPCTTDGDPDDAELGEATFTRVDAFVFASVPIDGLEPGDAVAAVWYFRTDDELPFEQAALSFEAQVIDDEGFLSTSTLASVDPACPVAGDYLVRLYAAERFLGEVSGTMEPTLLGDQFGSFADPIEGIEVCVPASATTERADLTELDAFTVFTLEDGSTIGINVTPGVLQEGEDPLELAEFGIDGVTDAPTTPVRLTGRDVDGNFLALDGLMAVDDDEVVALAIGPDSSARSIILQGDVSEELMRQVIGLIAFTGVTVPAA